MTELARANIQRPYLKFEQKRPSGKHILELEGVSKSYGDAEVVRSFTASIVRGEKIALMGRNGAGKTTLLNALLANSPTVPEAELRKTSGYDGPFLTDGKVIWGHEAAVGYFAQDHRALIQPGMTAFEWLHQWDPAASNEEIRGLLGQMLFPREDGDKRTEVLSGGEAARLIFCKLMLQKANVLVFDEPTNHLDLESINALNIALQRYQGTVLLCTHDEDLIDEVATRIWHFEGNHQITDFKGATRTTSRFRSRRRIWHRILWPASRCCLAGASCPPIELSPLSFKSQQSEQLSAGLIISRSNYTPPGPIPARTGRSAMLAAQDRIEVQYNSFPVSSGSAPKPTACSSRSSPSSSTSGRFQKDIASFFTWDTWKRSIGTCCANEFWGGPASIRNSTIFLLLALIQSMAGCRQTSRPTGPLWRRSVAM